MSLSRCLLPAVLALAGAPREAWKTYIHALPIDCPHGDCTAPGCRAYVADYFRVQWRIQCALAARRAREAAHAQG